MAELLFLTLCLVGSLQAADRPQVGAEGAESIAKQGEPYVLTPKSTKAYPSAITRSSGEVDAPEKMLKADGKAAVLRWMSSRLAA